MNDIAPVYEIRVFCCARAQRNRASTECQSPAAFAGLETEPVTREPSSESSCEECASAVSGLGFQRRGFGQFQWPCPLNIEVSLPKVKRALCCCGGGLYSNGAREPQSTTPEGRGGEGDPPPPNNRFHPNRCRSRLSRPRNLGRTGRRRRGAQEDAVW